MLLPAQTPNSPCVSPSSAPAAGKTIIHSSPSRLIAATENAVSLSSASTTGAVTAMAVPPQIAVPTPISRPSLRGAPSRSASHTVPSRAAATQITLIARPRTVASSSSRKSSRAPIRMIAIGSTPCTAKRTPSRAACGSPIRLPNSAPITMAISIGSIGCRPPMVNGANGRAWTNCAAMATAAAIASPGPYVALIGNPSGAQMRKSVPPSAADGCSMLR